jgi:hypothetical protein
MPTPSTSGARPIPLPCESTAEAAIEGPSSEGFYLYPTYGVNHEGVRADGGRGTPTPPFIYPDGESRDWTLDYDPDGNGVTVIHLLQFGSDKQQEREWRIAVGRLPAAGKQMNATGSAHASL